MISSVGSAQLMIAFVAAALGLPLSAAQPPGDPSQEHGSAHELHRAEPPAETPDGTRKKPFRAIHNMDEMHRMGGAPGMTLEGGQVRVPANEGSEGKPR